MNSLFPPWSLLFYIHQIYLSTVLSIYPPWSSFPALFLPILNMFFFLTFLFSSASPLIAHALLKSPRQIPTYIYSLLGGIFLPPFVVVCGTEFTIRTWMNLVVRLPTYILQMSYLSTYMLFLLYPSPCNSSFSPSLLPSVCVSFSPPPSNITVALILRHFPIFPLFIILPLSIISNPQDSNLCLW